MSFRSGRHFLHVPGPTNVPERIRRATARPTIDHRGPDFARMGKQILEDLQWVFGTSGPVFVFPSSATGCWEAALVNTLSPGDRVLGFDLGFFADGWTAVARSLGLEVDVLPGDWRSGLDPSALDCSARASPAITGQGCRRPIETLMPSPRSRSRRGCGRSAAAR